LGIFRPLLRRRFDEDSTNRLSLGYLAQAAFVFKRHILRAAFVVKNIRIINSLIPTLFADALKETFSYRFNPVFSTHLFLCIDVFIPFFLFSDV